MKKADFRNQQPIGRGSARMVYAHGEDQVVKFAKGSQRWRGIAQNGAEESIYRYNPDSTILIPIYESDAHDEWLVAARALSITKTNEIPDELKEKVLRFRRQLRFLRKEFDLLGHWKDIIHRGLFPESTDRHTAEQQEILDSEWAADLQWLISSYQLMPGDLCRPSSWGYYEGRFVLIDFGYTVTVHQTYYSQGC